MNDRADPFSIGTVLIDRFKLEKRIGAGGMGVVYQARDKDQDIDVALKVLRKQGFEDLRQLTDEFRVARDITHSNLVRLKRLVIRPEAAFFTMQLLEGVSLFEWVRGYPHDPDKVSERTGRIDLDDRGMRRLREILPGIVAGLEALHERKIVHRDIKPDNVMVVDSSPVLLDFGLAKTMQPSVKAGQTFYGTPIYTAPEMFSDHQATTASDAFSLGVVLYELLTGHPPFENRLQSMLGDKRLGRWPPLRENQTDFQDLIETITGFLAPNPKDRPAINRLLPGIPKKRPPELPFVGRQIELGVLHKTFKQCCNERSLRRVDIIGPSGIGKSRLVKAFLDELPREGETLILSGECHTQEDIPYKGLDGIINDLARAVAHQSDLQPELETLSSAFPGIRQSGYPNSSQLPPTRQEAISAFRRLMAHAAKGRQIVVFIDDAHWGTGDAAAFLSALQWSPVIPLMVIFAFHDEDRELHPLISGLRTQSEIFPTRQLSLRALEADEVRQLLHSTASKDFADRTSSNILERLGRTPYVINEIAEWIQEVHAPVLDL
ncbi:MAG: protein kinase, partial [Myxococcota bacterium]